MKSATTLAFACLGIVFCSPALTQQLSINRFDQNHSTIGFVVPIMGGLSEVSGKFTSFQVSILLDQSDFTKSRVKAVIAAESIDTGISDRDAHLRSAEFFDVAQHPDITFNSTEIVKRSGQMVALGTLEIRGVKKQVEVPFAIRGPQATPGSDQFVIGVAADLKIDRQDYGISWRHDVPGFVGDEVTVRIRLVSRPGRSGQATVP